MTNPNNGASLEDCHSNFFALTDLCGIKWRRLVSDAYLGSGGHHSQHHHHQSHGPLDDPVLSSYARCVASDILCVWRRSPHAKQNHSPPDPFQPQHGTTTPTQTSPHFMHSHQHGPHGGSVGSSQQNSQQLGLHSMQMMSSHLLGSGPHHHSGTSSGGPPPYSSSGQSHSHQTGQFGTSLSPITPHSQQSIFNSTSSASSSGPSLSGPKELWIFWYGEEPELSSLVHAQLLKHETEQGSWENGLSYECRTLLFKALHNLIERCLLAKDFVRIGKWFIQPSEEHLKAGGIGNNGAGSNSSSGGGGSSGSHSNRNNFPMQLSFSFAFFVHGESTVCMSVDVRQHPSVRRVGKQHLIVGQSPNQNVPVILAPYGLAGTLTGVSYRMSDPGTQKILEEWKQFYPVEAALKSPMYDVSTSNNSSHGPHSSPHPTANGSASSQQQHSPGTNQGASGGGPPAGIPPVLEVIVSGVRMRYPSCYVLTTEFDELPRSLDSNISNNSSATAPVALKTKSSKSTVKDSENAACPAVKSPGRPQGSLTVSQKVCQCQQPPQLQKMSFEQICVFPLPIMLNS